MQVKTRIQQESKPSLSHKMTAPQFEATPIYKNTEVEEQKDYLSITLFIGLAIFCATIFYISLKSLML